MSVDVAGNCRQIESMDAVLEKLTDLDTVAVSDYFQRPHTEVKSVDFCRRLNHALQKSTVSNDTNSQRKLVYLLCLHGVDINSRNESGNTALQEYLECPRVCPDVVEAFLRCGADAYVPNKDGRTAFALAYFNPRLAKTLKSVFMKYVPGLWRSVESDDVMNVRKLVNQWCYTKITKDGKSLMDQATNTGSESLVRVVRDIRPSMDLAYSVMAGDVQKARAVLELAEKVNVNFHNMGESGATPLFYAMLNNDLDMIHLLMSHGARADIPMSSGDDDIPLLMAALKRTDVVKTITFCYVIDRLSQNIIIKMFYMGCNLLLHSIYCRVEPEVVERVLTKGGAALVTCRDQDNLTARDIAEVKDELDYIKAIDKVVLSWCCETGSDVTNRRLLCLHGFPYIPSESEAADEGDCKIFEQLKQYTSCIEKFHQAVERGDIETVNTLIYQDQFSSKFEPCLVDSRTKVNAQPALHKAVLLGHREVMQVLVEAYLFLLGQRLDSVRDQFHRTVLHYAMAIGGGEDMVTYLSENGASEHVMDKDGRSPPIFKARKGLQAMRELLRYNCNQDFGRSEPNPWSVNLPVPFIGYMDKYVHGHLENSRHSHHHVRSHPPNLYLPHQAESAEPKTESSEESETESNQGELKSERDLLVDGSTPSQSYLPCSIL